MKRYVGKDLVNIKCKSNLEIHIIAFTENFILFCEQIYYESM